ncbi:MAG: argininosuccinate lyase [Gemmatimonadota bacterium]|nr:MAG: argininosuccinate lyase [Gemmatimonadota bacterium]
MWGGRIEGRLADEMVPLNDSLSVDYRLWEHDIRGSQAWARELGRAGVIPQDEAETVVSGLDAVAERLAAEGVSGHTDEDIHSLVERLLHEEIGEVAGKLHTGRSRNDQVATDLRLWGMEAAGVLDDSLNGVLGGLLSLAGKSIDLIMPGYTHLQRAQPVRAAHWALSHFWPLMRDRDRLRQARERASSLPLGSGALAGCPFPIDRARLREDLGFDRLSENSMDAVSDRDWVVDYVFGAGMIGTHMSRLCEDIVLFSSREFGYLRLGDGFSTGSSLMPQKRNPDVAELARGKAGRLIGNITALLTAIKGLPTGYNRDLQDDKSILFDSVDTLLLVLPALTGTLADVEFQPDNIAAQLDWQLLATDLADFLVKKGVPFRKAHDAVASLVLTAEREGKAVRELSEDALREAHPDFSLDVIVDLTWEASVEARASAGGTARSAIQTQLATAQAALIG